MARVRRNEVEDNDGNVVSMTPTQQANVQARGARIRDGFARIFDQEMAIAEKEEDVMQPLKKERTKLWRDLKKDVDITREVLELEYRQYKLARLSAESDEGDATLDAMHEVFAALHQGQTIDWVSVVSGEADAAE